MTKLAAKAFKIIKNETLSHPGQMHNDAFYKSKQQKYIKRQTQYINIFYKVKIKHKLQNGKKSPKYDMHGNEMKHVMCKATKYKNKLDQ